MRDDDTIRAALKALRDQGLDAGLEDRGRGAAAGGGRIRVGKGRVRLEYAPIVRRTAAPAVLGAIVTQLRQADETAGRTALLVAGHVTAPAAERLRLLGRHFIDTAGNAWLEGPGLYVWVEGRRPPEEPAARREGRAFTPAGLKTVFALLCDPELAAAPLRRLAAAAGVALGALPGIMADLQRRGDLAVEGRNRRLIGTKRLLDEWALAYARTLRPRTLAQTLAAPAADDWERWNLAADGARWGGEPAARLLVRHLTPGMLTIWAAKPPARLIVERRLTAPAPGVRDGIIEIRTPFWSAAAGAAAPRRDVVPPVLVYADLLATGDARCLETARLVHEKHLARLLPAG